MTLWKLVQISTVDYDEVSGFVVRARNEKQARIVASENAGGEGKEYWLRDGLTSCDKIESSGVTEVILKDANWG